MAGSRIRGLRLAGGQGKSLQRNPSDHTFSLEDLRSALPGEGAIGSKGETQEEEVNTEFFSDTDVRMLLALDFIVVAEKVFGEGNTT